MVSDILVVALNERLQRHNTACPIVGAHGLLGQCRRDVITRFLDDVVRVFSGKMKVARKVQVAKLYQNGINRN